MRTIAVFLTCLASIGKGCEALKRSDRLQGTYHSNHGSFQKAVGGVAIPNEELEKQVSLKVLATLLLRFFGPSAGWQMPRQLPQWPVRHGTNLAINSQAVLRCDSIALFAKKKGGGGKKGKNKPKKEKKTFADLQNFELKPFESSQLRELAEAVISSYSAKSGKTLLRSRSRSADNPKALWAASVAVMVVKEATSTNEAEHTGAEIVYSNLAALEMHGLASDGWKTLHGSPSLLPLGMGDKKFEKGYSKKLTIAGGVQVDGKRAVADGNSTEAVADVPATTVTMIEADRWVLEKMAVVSGKITTERLGIAYAWEAWEMPDGTICKPGGEQIEPDDPLPSREETQASLEKVGAYIRKLKEEDGKTNQDPEVQEKVEELKELKAILAEIDDND